MPKLTKRAPTKKYYSLNGEGIKIGERNDCSVIAVATLCSVSYEDAHKSLSEQGRKFGHGCVMNVIIDSIRSFGFKVIAVYSFSKEYKDIISSYPKPANNLKNITTGHVARYPNVWDDGQKYLFNVNNHVAAVVNGECHDWSADRALRVKCLYKVEEI